MEKYKLAKARSLLDTQIHMFDVDEWDIKALAEAVDLSQYQFVYFETRERTIDRVPGRVTYVSTALATSPTYYINAYVETYDDVRVKDDQLFKRMTNLGWTKIVRSVEHSWLYHFTDKDVLINVNGDAV